MVACVIYCYHKQNVTGTNALTYFSSVSDKDDNYFYNNDIYATAAGPLFQRNCYFSIRITFLKRK